MYTCNACCEVLTQTNILVVFLFLGGPNPSRGGGARGRRTGSYIAFMYGRICVDLQGVHVSLDQVVIRPWLQNAGYI